MKEKLKILWSNKYARAVLVLCFLIMLIQGITSGSALARLDRVRLMIGNFIEKQIKDVLNGHVDAEKFKQVDYGKPL